MLASRRPNRLGAVALALALVSVTARAEQRIVNFYNWSNYMAPDVLGNFTGQTGIKVVYDTFDANETLETRLLAGKSGYDSSSPPPISCSARSAPMSSRSSTSRSFRISPKPGRWWRSGLRPTIPAISMP